MAVKQPKVNKSKLFMESPTPTKTVDSLSTHLRFIEEQLKGMVRATSVLSTALDGGDREKAETQDCVNDGLTGQAHRIARLSEQVLGDLSTIAQLLGVSDPDKAGEQSFER